MSTRGTYESPMSVPPDGFEETFSGEFCDHVVDLLLRAYSLTIGCFNLMFPYGDPNTVGTDLYRISGNMLTEMAEQRPDLLEVVELHPGFRHRAGGFDLYCHRVANTRDDIWTSFPNSEAKVVSQCATYFLPGMEPDLDAGSDVVLAHMGNERDGLLSAYLCIPVRSDDGQIEWGYAKEIFSREAGEVPASSTLPDEPPPAPEDVEPAVVRRRVRRRNT